MNTFNRRTNKNFNEDFSNEIQINIKDEKKNVKVQKNNENIDLNEKTLKPLIENFQQSKHLRRKKRRITEIDSDVSVIDLTLNSNDEKPKSESDELIIDLQSSDENQKIQKNERSNFETRNLTEFIPWLTIRTLDLEGMVKLHCEILDFSEFLSPTYDEDHMRLETVNYLTSLIKSRFPCWKVKTFGSYTYGLHLPESDLDFVVITEKTNKHRLNQIKHLKTLSELMMQDNEFENVHLISAKVPIIKATYKKTNINLDISVNRKNGYAAKKIIKNILDAFPMIKPLIFVLKYYLKQQNLNEAFSGGVSSFLIFNLLLAFLQFKKKELILEKQKNQDENQMNLGSLLIGFFDFYTTDFNYKDVGISVKHGGSFFRKEERNWFDERRPELLSVENFQDPTQDIGKSVYKIKNVIEIFKNARDSLYLPSKFPIISYLSGFIQIDKFLIDRFQLKRGNNK